MVRFKMDSLHHAQRIGKRCNRPNVFFCIVYPGDDRTAKDDFSPKAIDLAQIGENRRERHAGNAAMHLIVACFEIKEIVFRIRQRWFNRGPGRKAACFYTA